MAWTHRSNLYRKSQKVFLLNYVGEADASDLSDYVLFDISASAPGYTKTQVQGTIRSSDGLLAVLEWDATTDDLITGHTGSDAKKITPPFDQEDLIAGNFLVDPASTGSTGDVVLTTLGGAVGKGVVIEAIITVL